MAHIQYGGDISLLLHKILTKIEVEERWKGHVTFTTTNGEQYKMYHAQDCCERVYLEDVVGDFDDLIGSPIGRAEKRTSGEPEPGQSPPEDRDTAETWTYYELATNKGSVTLRWFGSSNGYYSTEVDFGLVITND